MTLPSGVIWGFTLRDRLAYMKLTVATAVALVWVW